MSSELFILLFTSFITLFICSIVLFRGYKRVANIAFCLTALMLTLWSIFNYLSTHLDSQYTTYLARISGVLGLNLLASIYLFSSVFPSRIEISKRTRYFIAITLFANSLLALTSLMLKEATLVNGSLELTSGSLYHVYSLYYVFLGVMCIINFRRQYRSGNQRTRSQIQLLGVGLFITMSLGLISNIVMPALLDDWSTGKLGSLFPVPFIAITAYAIVKRKLFDIKLLIARTVAYVLTISVVLLAYSVAMMLLALYFADLQALKTSQIIALLIPAIFIAATFHSIKNFIDKVTKQIFYRDVYDTKAVIEKLSDALVSNNNIDSIIKTNSQILGDALNMKSVYTIVFDENLQIYKDYPSDMYPNMDIEKMRRKICKHSDLVIDKDEYIHIDRGLHKIMDENDIQAVLRLGSRNRPTGLVFVGLKSNGGIYSAQDIKVLELSSKYLLVAMDNAFKYEQILHFADTMHNEVEKATARLRTANRKLKTLDALKDDFIATASHQLRTPAASVHDTLKMINHPAMSNKDRGELLRLAEASSEHLVTVVRTMLNMARLQAGHFTIDKSNVDIVNLVTQAVEQMKVVADQKGCVIELSVPNHPLNIDVDSAKIGEAVSNYTENAIKYSPADSVINVRMFEADDKIYFEVADPGIGVPATEVKNLFGKFYRATNARKEEPDGNGIGLYVVRNIAEGHGGEAYYKSGDNGGSVFGFWISAETAKT
jgi:signal transduction histidine kinase